MYPGAEWGDGRAVLSLHQIWSTTLQAFWSPSLLEDTLSAMNEKN